MNMSAVIEQMLVLFFCIVVGFIARKAQILTPELQKGLSKLVLNVTMPAMILSSVTTGEERMPTTQVLLLVLIGFLLIVGRLLLSFPMTRLLSVSEDSRSAYHFMTAFSNLGFMGIPVVKAIFGNEAVFFAALFQIPFNILSFTVGIRLIAGKKHRLSVAESILHPALLASVAALVLYLTGLSLPSFLQNTAETIGNITTPSTMLIIGATLASIPLKQAFSEWRLYVFCGITLIAMPLLAYALLCPFTDEVMLLGVTTVLAAMPAATSSTMLCHEYGGGGDAGLCSSGVFLTTVFSLFTIPLLASLLFT